MTSTNVRVGTKVRIRSREEILATLDKDGSLAGLPFMPEMLKFAGQEFTVQASAHKTCDTVEGTGGTRELSGAVHLPTRCDGSAHGGCQAACLLFWRQEWLEPGEAEPDGVAAGEGATVEALHEATSSTVDGETVYHCQATEMPKAAPRLYSVRDFRHFAQDVSSGNIGRWQMVKSVLYTLFNSYQWVSRRVLPGWLRIKGGTTYPFYGGTGDGKRLPAGDIQVGDRVRVRSKEEIMPTLNAMNRNGGMLFDSEMLVFCGREATVERKVSQIINETNGRMIKLSDCLILSDMVCLGIYHRNCPRASLPYWREAWLTKVTPDA